MGVRFPAGLKTLGAVGLRKGACFGMPLSGAGGGRCHQRPWPHPRRPVSAARAGRALDQRPLRCPEEDAHREALSVALPSPVNKHSAPGRLLSREGRSQHDRTANLRHFCQKHRTRMPRGQPHSTWPSLQAAPRSRLPCPPGERLCHGLRAPAPSARRHLPKDTPGQCPLRRACPSLGSWHRALGPEPEAAQGHRGRPYWWCPSSAAAPGPWRGRAPPRSSSAAGPSPWLQGKGARQCAHGTALLPFVGTCPHPRRTNNTHNQRDWNRVWLLG